MTLSWFSQDFLRTFSGLSKDILRISSVLSHNFLSTFSGLSQGFLKTFSGFSQHVLRTVSGVSQDFDRTFSRLSQDAFRNFSELSQGFFRTFQDFLRTVLRMYKWALKFYSMSLALIALALFVIPWKHSCQIKAILHIQSHIAEHFSDVSTTEVVKPLAIRLTALIKGYLNPLMAQVSSRTSRELFEISLYISDNPVTMRGWSSRHLGQNLGLWRKQGLFFSYTSTGLVPFTNYCHCHMLWLTAPWFVNTPWDKVHYTCC